MENAHSFFVSWDKIFLHSSQGFLGSHYTLFWNTQ